MKTITSISATITTEESSNITLSAPFPTIKSAYGDIIVSGEGIILTKGKSQIKIPRQRLQELAILADPNFGK